MTFLFARFFHEAKRLRYEASRFKKEYMYAVQEFLSKTDAEIALAFAAIPPTVTHLNLNSSSLLGRKSGAELALAFAAIPRTVTHLNLSRNGLGWKSGEELALAFAAIPSTVTHLDLSDNYLSDKSGAEIALAFVAIPPTVTHLNLSGNILDKQSGAEIALAFAAIPSTVTHLNLSGNDLGNKSGAELALAFVAIPPTVTHLDLSYNDLGNKSGAQLALAFATIPPTVTHLDLSGNDLEYLSDEDFRKAFVPLVSSATPRQIIMSEEDFERFKKLHTPIDISSTSSLVINKSPQSLPEPKSGSEFIFSKAKKNQGAQSLNALSVELLTADNNALLNILTPLLFEGIAARVAADKQLPKDSRKLLPNKALYELDAQYPDQYIPELKTLNVILIKSLEVPNPLPELCAQIIKNENLPVGFLLHELPQKCLNELILQLRTHEPDKALELIVDLTRHILAHGKFEEIKDNPEFKSTLISHCKFISEKSDDDSIKKEFDEHIKELDDPNKKSNRLQ